MVDIFLFSLDALWSDSHMSNHLINSLHFLQSSPIKNSAFTSRGFLTKIFVCQQCRKASQVIKVFVFSSLFYPFYNFGNSTPITQRLVRAEPKLFQTNCYQRPFPSISPMTTMISDWNIETRELWDDDRFMCSVVFCTRYILLIKIPCRLFKYFCNKYKENIYEEIFADNISRGK